MCAVVRWFSCASTLATVSAVAVAAPAQAEPTITPTQPCYRAYDGVNTGSVSANVAGFTPGAYVAPASNQSGPASGPPATWDHPVHPDQGFQPIGQNGAPSMGSNPYPIASVASPLGAQSQKVGTVTVGFVEYVHDPNTFDYVPDGLFARADVKVVNFGISFKLGGNHAGTYTPRRSIQWTASGYIGSPTLYEHYVYVNPRTSAEVVKKTVALGTPPPPCGILVTTVPRWPIRHPAKGRWLIVFNTNATSRPTPDDIIYKIDVR